MQPEKILESDNLDILFEHRNKAYGAYDLRKNYNKRLLLAMAMGLLVMAIPTVYIGLKKIDKTLAKPDPKGFVFVGPTIHLPVPKPETKPAPKKEALPLPAEAKPQTNVSKNSGAYKIVKEDFVREKVTQDLPALPGTPGLPAGNMEVPAANSGEESQTSSTTTTVIPAKEVDVNTALPVAEQMPAYPGGLKALRKFLENNLESPRDLEEGEKVNVQVKFIVGYDGNLKSFELVKDGGALFNREVMRVLKLMPKWIPGKNAGKNVSVYFSLPVSFVAPE